MYFQMINSYIAKMINWTMKFVDSFSNAVNVGLTYF